MKKLAATLFASAAAAAMMAAPAGAENLSFYNSTSNWEEALGEGWTCVKTEVDDYFGSEVFSDADVVIVKGGNVLPVIGTTAPINPKSGKPYGISWYMECYGEPPSDPS